MLATAMLIWGCGGSSTKSQKEASQDSTNAMGESMDHISNDAINFAKDAATANLKEIELGKLAQTNANYGRLKAFGQKMIDAHTQSNNDLQKACYSAGVTLPAGLPEADRKDVDNLAQKKDKAFDRAFIKKMVQEHQATMEKLDAAAHNMKDTALQNYAKKTLPIVTAHLEEARHILEDIRKQYAPEQFDDVESYQ
jgi:putative membrane protein